MDMVPLQGEPPPNGVAAETQERSAGDASGRLAAGQQIQHMQALAFDRVALRSELLFKRVGVLDNRRNLLIHGGTPVAIQLSTTGYLNNARAARLIGITIAAALGTQKPLYHAILLRYAELPFSNDEIERFPELADFHECHLQAEFLSQTEAFLILQRKVAYERSEP